MTIEERAKKGSEYKATGQYNCTRSVLAAFSDLLDVDDDKLDKMAAGFAAGMGNMEGTCGALIGAVMVAGFLTEGNGTVRYARTISEKFKELSGATICKDLKGIESRQVLTTCPDAVYNAIIALGFALGME